MKKSYSKIRHIQKTNLLLEKRLIKEITTSTTREQFLSSNQFSLNTPNDKLTDEIKNYLYEYSLDSTKSNFYRHKINKIGLYYDNERVLLVKDDNLKCDIDIGPYELSELQNVICNGVKLFPVVLVSNSKKEEEEK